MDSESPPKKKLKQARLPFQVISPKKKEKELSVDSLCRKRPHSETSDENTSALKLFKSSEDSKENKSLENPSNVISIKTKSPDKVSGEDPSNKASETLDKEDVSVASEEEILCVTHVEGLSHEDLDSSEEVVEIEPSVSTKQQVSSKNESIPSKHLISNDSEVTKCPLPDSGKSVGLAKDEKKMGNEETTCKKVESQENEILINCKSPISGCTEVIEPTPVEKANHPNKSKQNPKQIMGMLSQKTFDMFSKWRKVRDGIEINPGNKTDSPEKAVEAVEGVSDKLTKEECHTPLVENVARVVCSSSDHAMSCKDKQSSDITSLETASGSDESEDQVKGSAGDCNSLNVEDVIDLTDNDCLSPQKRVNNTKVLHSMKVPNNIQLPRTPRQIAREKERKKKQQEKEKQKLERQMEKKRLKDEKDEIKKKEKEEKEVQRRKEREEKEKKRQAEIDLKNEEKKKKEELKAEEKKRKEEEKKKAEEEKRKADEEEERRKAKASAMFTSFFVSKPAKVDKEDIPQSISTAQNFMPFEVKADMRMAPQVRVEFHSSQKKGLDDILSSQSWESGLYLENLKARKVCPRFSLKTWPLEECKDNDDDDVCIVEQDETGVFIAPQKKREKMRAKFLQFHENHRPAYRGTWRKQSTSVTGRRPFGVTEVLDYEVDSADEWEEEEPGESLHGSDDEKEQESEDEYEVDNSVFVPHGYLSDDEGDADETINQVLSPETQKAKLKLLGEEFEAQMKSGTSSLKPIIIFLTAAKQASACKLGSLRYQKLLDRRAVWREDEGPIILSQFPENENPEVLCSKSGDTPQTGSSGPGAKKKLISEDAVPALITLIHGNQNKRLFLVKEFSCFLQQCGGEKFEKSVAEENGIIPGYLENLKEPKTPSKTYSNDLVNKWSPLPPASKVSISDKIKELAMWKPCPDEGSQYNRNCWYVPKETREHYGLLDLKLPNTWVYMLKPKVSSQAGSPNNVSVNNVGEPKGALITKFTKVMTPEEKQRQWDSMKSTGSTSSSKLTTSSLKSSAGKITAFTSQIKPQNVMKSSPSCESSSPLLSQQVGSPAQTKKRVPLLVSVPRGQKIASVAHCSLLKKFEASATATKKVKDIEGSKHNDECIVLD